MKHPRMSLAAAFGFTLLSAMASVAQAERQGAARKVIVVHGAFADGSGWRKVTEMLTRDGYKVTVVQDSQTLFADDVAATRRAAEPRDGLIVLVSYSYGGSVITQAGIDTKFAAPVHVAEVASAVGESSAELAMSSPAASNDIHPTHNGFSMTDLDRLRRSVGELHGLIAGSSHERGLRYASHNFRVVRQAKLWHCAGLRSDSRPRAGTFTSQVRSRAGSQGVSRAVFLSQSSGRRGRHRGSRLRLPLIRRNSIFFPPCETLE